MKTLHLLFESLKYLNTFIVRKNPICKVPITCGISPTRKNSSFVFFPTINLPWVIAPTGHLSYHLLTTDFRLQINGICFDKLSPLVPCSFLYQFRNSSREVVEPVPYKDAFCSVYISGSFQTAIPFLPPPCVVFWWPGCLTGSSNFLLLTLFPRRRQQGRSPSRFDNIYIFF